MPFRNILDGAPPLGGGEPVALEFRVTMPWRKAGCEGWRVAEAERRFIKGEYDVLEVRYADGQVVTNTALREDAARLQSGEPDAPAEVGGLWLQMVYELRNPERERVGWQDNADLMRGAADELERQATTLAALSRKVEVMADLLRLARPFVADDTEATCDLADRIDQALSAQKDPKGPGE